MKILIHDYGGHPFQVQLSRALALQGHEVVHGFAGGLLTPRGELCRRTDDPSGLSFREFEMAAGYRQHKYSFFRRHTYEAGYGVGVARFLEDWKPDLVVSGNTPSHPQRRIARTCRRLGIRFVSWVQDVYGVAVDKLARRKLPVVGALAGAWYLRMDRQAFQLSDGVIVITEDFIPLVTREGVPPDRILVLPNWAPLEDVPVRPRNNAWGARHGLQDGFNFFYTGTLAMKHNPGLLLALAERFRKEPNVRVVVISEGPGSEWLAARKTEQDLRNLHLLPFQRFGDMPEVLASADVLTAVLEPDAGVFSVPSKVLTYHCAARPILAAIPPENLAARIIRDTGSGFCVRPDDTAGFVDGAGRLREDPAGRERMGLLARTYAEDHFAINKVIERFQTLTDRLKA